MDELLLHGLAAAEPERRKSAAAAAMAQAEDAAQEMPLHARMATIFEAE